MRRDRLTGLAAALALVVASAVAAQDGPAGLAFYDPPAPLPAVVRAGCLAF